MEEYALASAEAAYEYPGEQAPMGFLAASHWWDIKKNTFTSQTFSENTNWDTATVHISLAEEVRRKATGRCYIWLRVYVVWLRGRFSSAKR